MKHVTLLSDPHPTSAEVREKKFTPIFLKKKVWFFCWSLTPTQWPPAICNKSLPTHFCKDFHFPLQKAVNCEVPSCYSNSFKVSQSWYKWNKSKLAISEITFFLVVWQNLCLRAAANSVKQFLVETAEKRFPRKNSLKTFRLWQMQNITFWHLHYTWEDVNLRLRVANMHILTRSCGAYKILQTVWHFFLR